MLITKLATDAAGPCFAWLAQGRDEKREWQKPFGGIGMRVDAPTMGLREALTLSRIADVDANIEMRNAYVAHTGENGRPLMRAVPGLRHMVRRDTGAVLGTVNRTFERGTYAKDFAEIVGAKLDDKGAIVDEPDGLNISSAGLLGNGEQAFVCVRLHEASTVAEGAHIQRYINMLTGCDGHTPRAISLTEVSAVCFNTLRRGFAQRVTRKHGADLGVLADMAQDWMAEAAKADAVYKLMAERHLTKDEAEAIVTLMYGSRDADSGKVVLKSSRAEENAAQVLEYYNGDGKAKDGSLTGVRPGAMTVFDILQAATWHLDHVAPPKRKADAQADAGEEYTGPTFDYFRREATDSLNTYRAGIFDIASGIVTQGLNPLALVGGAA